MSKDPKVTAWLDARAELERIQGQPGSGDNLTPGTPAYAANERVIATEKQVPAWKRLLHP